MGWFSRNRRPFSKAFLERLDRIEAAVESLVEPESAFELPAPEVIPAEIVSSRTVGGVEEFAWREITTEPNDTGGRSSDGYDETGGADTYAFAAKVPAEGESFVVRHWVATEQDDGQGGTYPLHEIRHTIVGGAVSGAFEAKIGLASQIGNQARWEYDWVEVVWDSALKKFVEFEGNRTSFDIGKAINTFEASNTDEFAYGIAVQFAGGKFYIHDTQQQYEFQPVPGTVVTMRVRPDNDGGNVVVFGAPNPIDGQCA